MTYADYEVKGFINKTLPWSNCFLVGIESNFFSEVKQTVGIENQ